MKHDVKKYLRLFNSPQVEPVIRSLLAQGVHIPDKQIVCGGHQEEVGNVFGLQHVMKELDVLWVTRNMNLLTVYSAQRKISKVDLLIYYSIEELCRVM